MLEKLSKVGAALVPNPGLWKEAAGIALLKNARGEVDVFAKAHVAETIECGIDRSAHTHVERARIKLVHLLLSATDAASGEERRHGVVDGFLHGRERLMGAVGASKSIAGRGVEFRVNRLEIALRQHHVAVENDDILALRPFHAIIARSAGPRVLFHEIAHIERIGIALCHLLAGLR